MKEITREQFKNKVEEFAEMGRHFNVESDDVPIRFLMYGCLLDIDVDCGIEGVINIHKPNTCMEVELDFSVIETIAKENEHSYQLTFNNGMSDVVIDVVW